MNLYRDWKNYNPSMLLAKRVIIRYFIIVLDQSKHDKKTQLKKNRPELECFEEKLGLKIQPIMCNIILVLIIADQIKFVFTLIDPKNHDYEFSFILDVSENKVYKGNTSLINASSGL